VGANGGWYRRTDPSQLLPWDSDRYDCTRPHTSMKKDKKYVECFVTFCDALCIALTMPKYTIFM
jgi:hypothetical protein